jgi:hypothetical protein
MATLRKIKPTPPQQMDVTNPRLPSTILRMPITLMIVGRFAGMIHPVLPIQ